MNTPIVDFVNNYIAENHTRLHMPGHKGAAFLGFEDRDITEISGADSLYFADSIIAESERNASELFGSHRTLFSAEGSSQCVKAMVYLAAMCSRQMNKDSRPLIVAARNVHTSFVHAAGLTDIDVEWLWGQNTGSICSCLVSPSELEELLSSLKADGRRPAAVYITSPDYLGGVSDIKGLAEVAHRFGTLLLVDNAHGAYLRFLPDSSSALYRHPLELGADMCCDSAHKTLPVLTGGAYLHISEHCPKLISEQAKSALGIFGSTSPSYLILESLDLCNRYLSSDYTDRLRSACEKLCALRSKLCALGFDVVQSDPLKLTIKARPGNSACDYADLLRKDNIECEFADKDYLVLMFTPENTDKDLVRLEESMKHVSESISVACSEAEDSSIADCDHAAIPIRRAMSIREALFSPSEVCDVASALGRICAAPTVSCPPAIPIAVSGEIIDETMQRIFLKNDIKKIKCAL